MMRTAMLTCLGGMAFDRLNRGKHVHTGVSITCLVLSLLVGAPWAKSLSTTVTTIHSSPSVASTIAITDGELVMLALWRGRPGWSLKGRGPERAGGSSDGWISVSLSRGPQPLSLSFNPQTWVVRLQGESITVPPRTNVIFIDHVDSSRGPEIVKTLSVKYTDENVDPRAGSVAPLFKRSPEIVSYLRCEAKLPPDATPPGAPAGMAELLERLSRGICPELE